jgi:hypothetical protein
MVSCLQTMSKFCRFVRVLAFMACVALSTAQATEAVDSTAEVVNLDQEIHRVRGRLAQVAIDLRDAKLLAAEKMMEYEAAHDQYQLDNNQVNANTMDHSQQRLALAEMGVESRAAKFERIQKKLEELAQLRQQLVGLPSEPAPQIEPAIAEAPTAKPMASPSTVPLIIATKPVSQQPATPVRVQTAQSAQPVISEQGKVTDTQKLNAQLQKLERHLIAAGTTADPAIKVKAYGTAIPGELILSPLGGNQYFARFIAPAGQVSLIIGARSQQYYRSALELEFLPQEQGEEFVLIFDMNQPADVRALVFPETMMFEQEMFAAHSDY